MQLLLIADDLTGALDTSVQFMFAGAKIKICAYQDLLKGECGITDLDIVAVNTNSRHASEKKACEIHKELAEFACRNEIKCIYKKTDSLLRGNFGADFSGLLEGTGWKTIFFVPAAPQIGRTTKNGIQYADGVPIHESIYAKNSIEPIEHSDIAQIIQKQSDIGIRIVREEEKLESFLVSEGIWIFDTENMRRFQEISEWLNGRKDGCIIAGCAGFGSVLAKRFETKKPLVRLTFEPGNMLTVSGTANPLTCEQIRYAKEEHDYKEVVININDYYINACRKVMLESIRRKICNRTKLIIAFSGDCDEERKMTGLERLDCFAGHIGKIVAVILEMLEKKDIPSYLFITGGDTANAVLESVGCKEIRPLCELERGVVLALAKTAYGNIKIITKSGALGSVNVFEHVFQILNKNQEEGEKICQFN